MKGATTHPSTTSSSSQWEHDHENLHHTMVTDRQRTGSSKKQLSKPHTKHTKPAFYTIIIPFGMLHGHTLFQAETRSAPSTCCTSLCFARRSSRIIGIPSGSWVRSPTRTPTTPSAFAGQFMAINTVGRELASTLCTRDQVAGIFPPIPPKRVPRSGSGTGAGG